MVLLIRNTAKRRWFRLVACGLAACRLLLSLCSGCELCICTAVWQWCNWRWRIWRNAKALLWAPDQTSACTNACTSTIKRCFFFQLKLPGNVQALLSTALGIALIFAQIPHLQLLYITLPPRKWKKIFHYISHILLFILLSAPLTLAKQIY